MGPISKMKIAGRRSTGYGPLSLDSVCAVPSLKSSKKLVVDNRNFFSGIGLGYCICDQLLFKCDK